MNRETKRAMARQQKTGTEQAERYQQLKKQQVARQQQAKTATNGKGGRRGLRNVGSFGGEVTTELRKVIWPDRRMVIGYTMVVLVAVVTISIVIFGLDTLFGRAVLAVFGK